MIIKIKDDHPFSIVGESFAVSDSATGYELQYSVNGENWTTYEEPIPANETLIVNGLSKELFYKLKGNVGTVTVKY